MVLDMCLFYKLFLTNPDILINHQKIEILCQDCNTKSTLEKHEFSCPKCQSTNLTVTDGEDMYLMSLEME